MTPQERDAINRRRQAALQRLDAGHQELLQSLENLDIEEAFLGSRWSVREVLLHLDSERYIDALEQIARGERQMLPPFSSREEHFRQEREHQEATHQRLRTLLTRLTPEQLARPATPANPENAYPALTLLELLERSANHESAHARQIQLTRHYIAAYRTQQRALNIIILPNQTAPDNPPIPANVKDLLNMADYLIGDANALAIAAPYARGVRLTLTDANRAELVNRAARETREGQWPLICLQANDPNIPETLTLARQHADTVAIHPPEAPHPPTPDAGA